jgi:hypothetical protein
VAGVGTSARPLVAPGPHRRTRWPARVMTPLAPWNTNNGTASRVPSRRASSAMTSLEHPGCWTTGTRWTGRTAPEAVGGWGRGGQQPAVQLRGGQVGLNAQAVLVFRARRSHPVGSAPIPGGRRPWRWRPAAAGGCHRPGQHGELVDPRYRRRDPMSSAASATRWAKVIAPLAALPVRWRVLPGWRGPRRGAGSTGRPTPLPPREHHASADPLRAGATPAAPQSCARAGAGVRLTRSGARTGACPRRGPRCRACPAPGGAARPPCRLGPAPWLAP